MSVPWRHARWQGPVVGSFVRLALTGRHLGSKDGPVCPGPRLRRRFSPRAPDHLAAYREHVGLSGAPDTVPPHLFPHWCFPLTGRLVGRLPWPMLRALNAGCDVRVRGRIPAEEPIEVEGWLESVDVGERRVLVTQRFVTSTPSAPEVLEADVTLLVRVPAPPGPAAPRREGNRVPELAAIIDNLDLGPTAGLDFAKLTGDFNPLHWSRPYARAMGFPSTILHGFATAARTWAALEAHLDRPLSGFECRFPRPVVLPAHLGVYVRGGSVWVGASGGDEAHLVGHFA